MICFDRVTFDFIKGQIGLGKTCIPIESTLTGGSPLFRAQTSMRDSTVAGSGAGSEDFDIAPELEKQEYRELARLLE